MQREPSDSSTTSNSRIRRIGSRLRRFGSKAENVPVSPLSDAPPIQKFVHELDSTETATSLPPDPAGSASDDPSLQQLRDNIRHLKGASLGVNGVDSTFSNYSRCREQSLELCKNLVQKSKSLVSASLLDANLSRGSDERQYEHGFTNDAWITAIQDFKAYQEGLLENLRESITSTYLRYEKKATTSQIEALFADKSHRNWAISRMETISDPLMRPETPEYWPKYAERFRNYDQLQADHHETENLCSIARSGKEHNVAIREYEIATNGDSVLEFANSASEIHPVLRFRVSSYMLIEASPFFARIFSSSHSDQHSPLELPDGFPPHPVKQLYRDGTEVKVYRMPQVELNKWEALTTVLHAAHMHNDQIPREVRYYEFVSIAEVCLRYQCTSPLEMAVEYLWLPQWIHKANEDAPDGFLLISFVFGLRRLFTRTSKSVILHVPNEEEIENKVLWPREVREKITSIREAKLAQIYASCASTMKEYIKITPMFRAPERGTDYTLTSAPKCSKDLHQCDAANLGWLMLVYNELGILPVVMDTVNSQYPFVKSNRSISSLVNSLRRMPSAPQLHSGVCDYAPAFRRAIDDIYNSITGLTLRDVTGINGWALSKRHDVRAKFSDEALQEVFELPAPVEQKGQDNITAANEAVSLRILSHLDDIQDLHAAAMINKAFYSTYKKHELALIKALLKRSKSQKSEIASPIIAGPDIIRPENGISRPGTNMVQQVIRHEPFMKPKIGDPHFLQPSATHTKARPLRLLSIQTSEEDLYGTTPPTSPGHQYPEMSMTSAEVEEILWPSETPTNGNETKSLKDRLKGSFHKLDPESNAKFLSGDAIHVDKSLVIEGRKHLRDELDRNLRIGIPSLVSQPP